MLFKIESCKLGWVRRSLGLYINHILNCRLHNALLLAVHSFKQI